MQTVKVKIDGHEHQLPRACRAVHVLVAALLDSTYRIFRDVDGVLVEQLHPGEFIFPQAGDQFVCVPYAVGPGGGDDLRVQMIRAAIATDEGDDEAWDRFEWANRD